MSSTSAFALSAGSMGGAGDSLVDCGRKKIR